MSKQFAGIFSTAPSILLAGLAITLISNGASHAVLTAQGAIAGALGMVFYCVIATPIIKRHKELVGSILALAGWFLVSYSAFALISVILKW
jgi:heme O synthase-like polyprenyltransferase